MWPPLATQKADTTFSCVSKHFRRVLTLQPQELSPPGHFHIDEMCSFCLPPAPREPLNTPSGDKPLSLGASPLLSLLRGLMHAGLLSLPQTSPLSSHWQPFRMLETLHSLCKVLPKIRRPWHPTLTPTTAPRPLSSVSVHPPPASAALWPPRLPPSGLPCGGELGEAGGSGGVPHRGMLSHIRCSPRVAVAGVDPGLAPGGLQNPHLPQASCLPG